jgi:hypothetical protein
MHAYLVGLAALTSLPIPFTILGLFINAVLYDLKKENRKLILNGEFGENMHCP